MQIVVLLKLGEIELGAGDTNSDGLDCDFLVCSI